MPSYIIPNYTTRKRAGWQHEADKISLQVWETGYLDVTKTIKTALPHMSHLMCSLLLLLTISWHLALASIASVFHICWSSLGLSYGWGFVWNMIRKFQGFSKCRFGGSEKDRYFLEIPKRQHKLIREYKQGKLAS